MKQAKIKKYVTLNEDGMDFRTMAEIMTSKGYKMNHATARNHLILAIKNLVGNMSTSLNVSISAKDIDVMIKSQDVHEQLSDVLYKAYEELRKEGNL